MRKPPFVPKLYRNAPRRTKDGFVQHIHEKENARGNQISMVQADEIFRILMQQSYTAKRYGRPDEIWISHDSRSGEWGGYETPFKVYGISQRIKKGSYRDKLGKLPPMSRLDMLDAIVSIYGGSIGRAEQIFNVIKQGILIFDKETNTWRGCDCTDLPTLDDAVVIEPRRTTKQEEYRARYGTMPPGRHKWKDLTKSDPVKWIAELDGVPLEEALKRYDRHWHCSRDKSKIPYVQDPETKLVRGVNYIVQVAPADRILEQRWFDRKGRPAEAGDDSADDLQYWLGGVNVTVAYCKLDLLNMPDRTMEESRGRTGDAESYQAG